MPRLTPRASFSALPSPSLSPSSSPLFHLLVVLVLVLLLGLNGSMMARGCTDYAIAYTTWGPHFVNPDAVQRINASLYAGALPPVDYSLPTLRLAGVITLEGEYSEFALDSQMLFSWMLDAINMKGGVRVANQSYLVSLTWTSDDSSLPYLNVSAARAHCPPSCPRATPCARGAGQCGQC